MSSPKLNLPFIEMMATQVCNLRCYGCSNYSELSNRDYLTWSEAKQQIEPWLERLDFLDFGIIGGEPLINPDIIGWIEGARNLLPNAQIRFTTNGILLPKYPDLLRILESIGNCVFKITVHQSDLEIEEYIVSVLSQPGWHEIVEHGIRRWRKDSGLRFQVNRPEIFLKTFRGSYHDMRPHDNEPAQAFAACIQQTCPLLYKGRIHKCSTAGLLADTLSKLDNPNLELWAPYVDPGIGPDSSYRDLAAFVDNFGRPHARCRQCPNENDKTIDHSSMIFKRNQSVEMISKMSV